MEFLIELWLPILLSSVMVFLGGSVMNMLLPHHTKDYTRLPDEDALREVMQAQQLSPAQYAIPFAHSKEDWRSEAVKKKFETGPVGLLIVGPNGSGMSRQFIQQAIYVLSISIMVAYVAYAAFGGTDQEYLKVFQVAGTVATLGYSGALFLNSIWFNVPWGNTWRHAFDGLVYGLLTAGIFGWLW